MSLRRVFIIWTNPLFHDSVRLLLQDPEIIWVGATADMLTAHEEITNHHPATIFYRKTGAGIPADVIEILAKEP